MSNKVANEEKETSPMIKFSEDHKVKKDAQVGIQVVVRRIYDIDNIRQTFACALTIFCYWYAEEDDHNKYVKDDAEGDTDWKPENSPRMHISNNLGCEWSDAQFAYTADERKVVRVIDCACTIRDEMEFNNFPFDYQLLPIKISLKHDADAWEIVPFDYNEVSGVPASVKHVSVLNKRKMDFPDFNFLTHQPKSPSYCVTDFACLRIVKFDASAGLRSSMSQVCLFVPLERRSRFYIFNNFGIMFLITSMTFLIWVVDVDDAGDRLALDMTLLLTIVAFKLVQAGLIPAVSYLTLLDKYTVMNFVVLLAASVCHFVAFYKPDTDGILWAICGGFWIIMNCVFVLQCSNLSKVNLENWRTERQRYIDNGEVWYVEESAQCTSHKKDELSHKKDK